MALCDIDLFATDLPCKEVLEAAWAEVTPSQAAELVEEMAALCPELRELPLKEAWHTMAGVLSLIYLVLPFGFSGSSGRFGVVALLPELIVQSRAPAQPRINGSEPLDVKTHVDNAARSEVKAGYRPWLSRREYNGGATRVFGKGAVHPRKDLLEGRPSFESCWWGCCLSIWKAGNRITVPEVKLEELSHVVYMNIWDWGCRRIPRVEAQAFRGMGTFVGQVCKGIRPEMASFDRALGGPNQASLFVEPAGTPEEQEVIFRNLWWSAEVVRILIFNKGAWGRRYSSSCAGVLRPEQRVTLPGEAEKVGWQGGDATPEVGAHVDWAGKTFVREEMQDGLYQAVAELRPGAPVLVIIAIAELLMYVATACVEGSNWRGTTKWYASDNMNTYSWIWDRFATNPIAQFLPHCTPHSLSSR